MYYSEGGTSGTASTDLAVQLFWGSRNSVGAMGLCGWLTPIQLVLSWPDKFLLATCPPSSGD